MHKSVYRFIQWLVRIYQIGLECYLGTIAGIFKLNAFTDTPWEDILLLSVTMSQASAWLSPWCSGWPATVPSILLGSASPATGLPLCGAQHSRSGPPVWLCYRTAGPRSLPPSSGNLAGPPEAEPTNWSQYKAPVNPFLKYLSCKAGFIWIHAHFLAGHGVPLSPQKANVST